MRNLLYVVLVLSIASISCGNLHLMYKWKYIDFLWESSQQKQQAIDSGRYDPKAIFPYDVDIAPDGRVFITTIRDKGVPVGVSIVTEEQGEGGSILHPYPDWSWYKDDCKGITGGVYQIEIKCNHLFVIDGGKIGANRLCPAQLLIFNLSTDKLVKRVIIPRNIADNKNSKGLLTTLTIFAPNCRDIKNNMIVFIGDTKGYGLVVYNACTSKLCRIESDFMKPVDSAIILQNETVNEAEGIFSMTLVRNELYYGFLPGSKIYKIQVSKIIDDCSLSDSEANKLIQLASTLLSGQTVSLSSEECAIFFSNILETSIMCADTSKKIISDNMMIIAQDSEMLQFPSALKNKQSELLIVTNKYNRQITDTLNLNETNFRVLSINMQHLRKQTNCFASCSYKGK